MPTGTSHELYRTDGSEQRGPDGAGRHSPRLRMLPHRFAYPGRGHSPARRCASRPFFAARLGGSACRLQSTQGTAALRADALARFGLLPQYPRQFPQHFPQHFPRAGREGAATPLFTSILVHESSSDAKVKPRLFLASLPSVAAGFFCLVAEKDIADGRTTGRGKKQGGIH